MNFNLTLTSHMRFIDTAAKKGETPEAQIALESLTAFFNMMIGDENQRLGNKYTTAEVQDSVDKWVSIVCQSAQIAVDVTPMLNTTESPFAFFLMNLHTMFHAAFGFQQPKLIYPIVRRDGLYFITEEKGSMPYRIIRFDTNEGQVEDEQSYSLFVEGENTAPDTLLNYVNEMASLDLAEFTSLCEFAKSYPLVGFDGVWNVDPFMRAMLEMILA